MSAPARPRQAIGQILVEKELITPAQLEAALAEQRASGGLLGEILVAQGLVDRVAIASVLVHQWTAEPGEFEWGEPGSAPAEAPADESRVAALEARIAQLEATVEAQRAELARRKEQLELLAEIVSGLPATAEPTPQQPGAEAATSAAEPASGDRYAVVPQGATLSGMAPPRLGDLLVSKGFVTEEQLSEALVASREKGIRLGRYLLSQQLIFEPELARTLSEQWGIPYLNLAVISVDRHAARLLPLDIGRTFDAIPVRYLEGAIQVAFADPSDTEALAAVRQHIPSVAPAVAELSDIESAWHALEPG